MQKSITIIAILFLISAVYLTYSIQEYKTEEVMLDKWDPITPSVLNVQGYENSTTGWAFMVLTKNGKYLELNISASGDVAVRVGLLSLNDSTGEKIWTNVIFNQTGTRFTQRINITEKNVDFLEIENMGTEPVNIYGSIQKLGDINKLVYPYVGLGTLFVFLGLVMLVYGLLAKPRKRKRISINKTKIQSKILKF